MRKLQEFFEALEARNKEHKAARLAHLRSIGRLRRWAYHGVMGLAIGIIATGVLTKTIHTAFLVAMVVLLVRPLILRGRRWRRRLVLNAAFSPVVMFPAVMAIGGLSIDMDYERVAEEQAILRSHTEQVARDGAQFLEDYKSGKVEMLGNLQLDHYPILLGANDRFGYEAAKWVFGLIHLRAPESLDTAAILPLAEMLYADDTVVLYDREIVKRHMEEERQHLEAEFGMPHDEIPAEQREKALPDYRGIFTLACSFKNNGEILLATGMGASSVTDLRFVSGAEAFVEVCRSIVLDDINTEQASAVTTHLNEGP